MKRNLLFRVVLGLAVVAISQVLLESQANACIGKLKSRRCCKPVCCEKQCCEKQSCEPKCCEKQCEPQCCEKQCCEKKCRERKCRDRDRCRTKRDRGGRNACCEPACESGCCGDEGAEPAEQEAAPEAPADNQAT